MSEQTSTTTSIPAVQSASPFNRLDTSPNVSELKAESPSLSLAVKKSVDNYLDEMAGQEVKDLYDLLLSEIEAPLLAAVMEATNHNQSSSSNMLGLNRGTLRKKLKKYGLV